MKAVRAQGVAAVSKWNVVVGRRYIWRGHIRAGSRADIPWRRHHLGIEHASSGSVVQALASAREHLAATSPRVWVVMNAKVTCQLIRATEALRTAGKGTGMWLLAGMCPNMTGLMLESVKGLLTDRTFVRSWHITAGQFDASTLESALHSSGN